MSKFVPLLLIALIFYSCTGSSARKEPKKKGNSWVLNDDGDSVLYRYSEKGVLESFSTYKNGRKEGLAKSFYPDGQVKFEILYKNGVKDGITRWYYENGKLYKETPYRSGVEDGIVTKYYRSGKLKAEEPYEKGEVVPGLKEYTKNGTLKKLYPTLQIEPIDRLAFENKYILRCSLSEDIKSVKYFKVTDFETGIYKEEVPSSKGIADFEYIVPRGHFLMKKEIIRAEYKTVLSNIYVIEKVYNLALDN